MHGVAGARRRVLDRDLDVGRQTRLGPRRLSPRHDDDPLGAGLAGSLDRPPEQSGRPHSGCSTFGSLERMRVPRPAAMISTAGKFTEPSS